MSAAIHHAILKALKAGAPGLSEPVRTAIATAIGINLRAISEPGIRRDDLQKITTPAPLTTSEQIEAKHDWPYTKTFDAIATAVEGIGEKHISISVAKFAASFGPLAALRCHPQVPASAEGLREAVAQWLHDETDHPDAWPDHTWPEHSDDTGQRQGAFIKIVPCDVQAKFREIAGRMVARFTLSPREIRRSQPTGTLENDDHAYALDWLRDQIIIVDGQIEKVGGDNPAKTLLAMVAQAPASGEADAMRCTICGFVVDTRFKAEKPTAKFTMAGRGKKASRESKLREALAARCYSMSEPHLSGARLIIGFDTIEAAGDAQQALSTAARRT